MKGKNTWCKKNKKWNWISVVLIKEIYEDEYYHIKVNNFCIYC